MAATFIFILTNCNDDVSDTDTDTDASSTEEDSWFYIDGRQSLEYVKPVLIPTYDSKNTSHCLVSNNDELDAHINNISCKYIYVSPGIYDVARIRYSNSNDTFRYITLNRNDEEHPSNIAEEEQANMRIFSYSAKNWIIDRISTLNDNADEATTEDSIIIEPGSKNLIFNRMNFKNLYEPMNIQSTNDDENFTSDITVQNSKFDRMTDSGLDADRSAILIHPIPSTGPGYFENIHIINNEIINHNDGIQALRHIAADGSGPEVEYRGLVIHNNVIYTTDELYTDCDGNRTPTGKCGHTENAIDLKAGSYSANSEDRIIISNNIMWGFRWTDQNNGPSGDRGQAIVIHFGAQNITIDNNIIFDTNTAIAMGAKKNFDYASQGVIIKNNIIAEISLNRPDENPECAIRINESNAVSLMNNIVLANHDYAYWLCTGAGNDNVSIKNNVFINGKQCAVSADLITDNYFYNTDADASYGTFFLDISDAKMADLEFSIEKFVDNPQTKKLYNVISTDDSPHGSGIGINLDEYFFCSSRISVPW